MPAIKCMSYVRYDAKTGCKLAQTEYYKFRDCMIDKKDYSFQLAEEKDNGKDLQSAEHPYPPGRL